MSNNLTMAGKHSLLTERCFEKDFEDRSEGGFRVNSRTHRTFMFFLFLLLLCCALLVTWKCCQLWLNYCCKVNLMLKAEQAVVWLSDTCRNLCSSTVLIFLPFFSYPTVPIIHSNACWVLVNSYRQWHQERRLSTGKIVNQTEVCWPLSVQLFHNKTLKWEYQLSPR